VSVTSAVTCNYFFT